MGKLEGCSRGIGVGLDKDNVVDLLKPGLPAEKTFKMGDKVTHWNGIAMMEFRDGKEVQKKLKDVVQPNDTHTVTVERERKQWESSPWETSYTPTSWETKSW